LALKACAVCVYEDMRESHLRHITPAISVTVAIDLAKMSRPDAGRRLAREPAQDTKARL
jgi:hypothetical protein